MRCRCSPLQVPRQELRLALQSRVDPTQLLTARPAAQLHLTTKGVSLQHLQRLVDCARDAAAQRAVLASNSSSDPAGSSSRISSHSVMNSDCYSMAGATGWDHDGFRDNGGSAIGDVGGGDGGCGINSTSAVGGGQLVALHLQRSHELTDEALGAALAALPHVQQLTLTTCRNITCGTRGGWCP